MEVVMRTTGCNAHRITSLLLVSLLCVAFSYSQITVQVGAGGGIAIPMSDYGGSTVDFYNGTKYGMPTGFTLHAKARLGLLGFRVAGEVGYSSFSSSGEAQPGAGSVELSHNVLSLKLGPELTLGLPLVPVSPYLGANVALNRFSGEVKFQGITKVPSSTQDLQSASRIGFGFTGGVILKLGGMTLDVSAAYDLLNASGKKWEDAVGLTDQRIDSYTSLNDDKDPLYRAGDDKHFINNSRSINALQLRATLMFGI
jgi:hypothetical protein